MCEVGLSEGYKWTVVIDADVYVHQAGFERLVAVAEAQPPTTFYVQGLTIDKYIPIIRTAGTGIYRTATLPQCLKGIPHGKKPLRPETQTVQSVLRRGYRLWRTDIVVGLHDFDQQYVDIARKAYLHAHKHRNVLAEMLAHWHANQADDRDFQAALIGHEHSVSNEAAPEVDRTFLRGQFEESLLRQGLSPKPDLRAGEISPDFVADFVGRFRPDPELQAKKFPNYQGSYYVGVNGTKSTRRLAHWRWRFRSLLAGK